MYRTQMVTVRERKRGREREHQGPEGDDARVLPPSLSSLSLSLSLS
jgi:hypothetical protein